MIKRIIYYPFFFWRGSLVNIPLSGHMSNPGVVHTSFLTNFLWYDMAFCFFPRAFLADSRLSIHSNVPAFTILLSSILMICPILSKHLFSIFHLINLIPSFVLIFCIFFFHPSAFGLEEVWFCCSKCIYLYILLKKLWSFLIYPFCQVLTSNKSMLSTQALVTLA